MAGDNTRSRHNQRHFSYYATSLCAPATQQHGAVACTLRQVRRSIRSPPCGSNGEDRRHSHRKVSFTHYATRSQVQRTTRTCSLVQTVLLGAYLLAAVAARVPSLKLHIPFISTLRISFRFGCGCSTQSKVPSRQSQNFVIESRLVRRGNLVETKLQTFSTPVPQLFIVNYSLFIIY